MSYVNEVNDNGTLYDIWDKRFGEGAQVFDGEIKVDQWGGGTYGLLIAHQPTKNGVFKLVDNGYFGALFSTANSGNKLYYAVTSRGIFVFNKTYLESDKNFAFSSDTALTSGAKLYKHVLQTMSSSTVTGHIDFITNFPELITLQNQAGSWLFAKSDNTNNAFLTLKECSFNQTGYYNVIAVMTTASSAQLIGWKLTRVDGGSDLPYSDISFSSDTVTEL